MTVNEVDLGHFSVEVAGCIGGGKLMGNCGVEHRVGCSACSGRYAVHINCLSSAILHIDKVIPSGWVTVNCGCCYRSSSA